MEEYNKKFKEMLLAKLFEPLFSKEEDERIYHNSRIRKATEKWLAKGMKEEMDKKEIGLVRNFKEQGVDMNIIS